MTNPGSGTVEQHSPQDLHAMKQELINHVENMKLRVSVVAHGTLERYYDVGKAIGRGKFSTVYKAIRRADGVAVALKRIAFYDIADAKSREKALKEIALVQDLEFQHIIRYYEGYFEAGELYLVFEFAEAGDLKRQIRKARERESRFDERVIWKYFAMLASAIALLHSKRIMHRDLKPANVFLTLTGQVKVGDLGLGRLLSMDTLEARSRVGTPLYMAPEVLRGSGYDFPADIWSLGCILYELAMLRSPFKEEGITLYALFTKISSGIYSPVHSVYSPELSSLVASMLSLNPADRPDAYTVTKIAMSMRERPSRMTPVALPPSVQVVPPNAANNRQFIPSQNKPTLSNQGDASATNRSVSQQRQTSAYVASATGSVPSIPNQTIPKRPETANQAMHQRPSVAQVQSIAAETAYDKQPFVGVPQSGKAFDRPHTTQGYVRPLASNANSGSAVNFGQNPAVNLAPQRREALINKDVSHTSEAAGAEYASGNNNDSRAPRRLSQPNLILSGTSQVSRIEGNDSRTGTMDAVNDVIGLDANDEQGGSLVRTASALSMVQDATQGSLSKKQFKENRDMVNDFEGLNLENDASSTGVEEGGSSVVPSDYEGLKHGKGMPDKSGPLDSTPHASAALGQNSHWESGAQGERMNSATRTRQRSSEGMQNQNYYMSVPTVTNGPNQQNVTPNRGRNNYNRRPSSLPNLVPTALAIAPGYEHTKGSPTQPGWSIQGAGKTGKFSVQMHLDNPMPTQEFSPPAASHTNPVSPTMDVTPVRTPSYSLPSPWHHDGSPNMHNRSPVNMDPRNPNHQQYFSRNASNQLQGGTYLAYNTVLPVRGNSPVMSNGNYMNGSPQMGSPYSQMSNKSITWIPTANPPAPVNLPSPLFNQSQQNPHGNAMQNQPSNRKMVNSAQQSNYNWPGNPLPAGVHHPAHSPQALDYNANASATTRDRKHINFGRTNSQPEMQPSSHPSYGHSGANASPPAHSNDPNSAGMYNRRGFRLLEARL